MKQKRLLVIALSGIGDALMFTPALRRIREERPDLAVDVLLMYKAAADIYERSGLADRVLFFDFLNANPLSALRYVLSLRGKYDFSISVYPSNRKEYAVISFLIGADRRGGIKYKRVYKKEMGFLNNVLVDEDDQRHNTEHNLMIAAKLLGFEAGTPPELVFNLTGDDRSFAEEYIRTLPQGKRVIGMHPGCSLLKNHIKRRWEPEKFASLAKKLITDDNALVLIFGGPEEEELKEYIRKECNSEFCFSVKTKNLAQSAAIIGKCDVFVTNDSSQMHVAAAMQRKTIAIIGPTNTSYIYPWRTEHTIVSLGLECSPCFFYSPSPLSCSRSDVQFKCIKELDTQMVYTAVKKYL